MDHRFGFSQANIIRVVCKHEDQKKDTTYILLKKQLLLLKDTTIFIKIDKDTTYRTNFHKG